MLVNYGPPKRGPHTALGKPSYNYTTAWMHALKLSIEDSLKMAAKMLAKNTVIAPLYVYKTYTHILTFATQTEGNRSFSHCYNSNGSDFLQLCSTFFGIKGLRQENFTYVLCVKKLAINFTSCGQLQLHFMKTYTYSNVTLLKCDHFNL